jgi:hypothetical protein
MMSTRHARAAHGPTTAGVLVVVAKLVLLLALAQQVCQGVSARALSHNAGSSLALVEPRDGASVLPKVQLRIATTIPPSDHAQDYHVCMEVLSLSFDARSLG